MGENELKKKSSASDKQAASVSINWELANTEAAEWARRYGHELVQDLSETTVRRLNEEIANFIERGDMTIPQLKKQLIPLFGEKRADLIATTEVTRAFAEGNLTAWKETGFTEGKEWVTANDELVCPLCGPLDGEVVPLNGDFSDGTYAPPRHPRCRCGVSPVPILDMEVEAPIEEQPPIAPVEPVPITQEELQPAGEAVTEHLAVIDKDDRARFGDESLRAIDSVHGDGDLPRMRGVGEKLQPNTHGEYRTKVGEDIDYNLVKKPDKIAINYTGDHPNITFVHETGHYIDDWGFDTPGYASEESPAMKEWRKAVNKSDAVEELRDRGANPENYSNTFMRGGKSYTIASPEKYLNYASQERELWARSYSQYVAEKSDSIVLKGELADMVSKQTMPMHWSTEDFAPIKSAIDGVFKEKGWLK